MNSFRTLLFPGGLVVAAALVAERWSPAHAVASYAPVLLCVAVGAGLLLAWKYNRTRAAAMLLLLAVAAWSLPALLANEGTSGLRPQLLCILLPLNVTLLMLWKDQAVLAPASLASLLVLAAQGVCFAALPLMKSARWNASLAGSITQPAWPSGPWIGQIGLLTFAGMVLALIAIFFRRRTPLEHGMFWGLAAAFLAFLYAPNHAASSLYFSAAAMVVGVSVLDHAHELAYRDELTRLANRRALNEFLPQVGDTYAVAVMDVDHFKKFNDTYGHDVGDEVLRMVAAKFTRLEAVGRVYRYGGEEFVAVFPGFSKEQAFPFVESVRIEIEKGGFRVRGGDRRVSPAGNDTPAARVADRRKRRSRLRSRTATVGLTVSIGLAEPGQEWRTPDLVIAAADKALYRAKNSGRNRTECA